MTRMVEEKKGAKRPTHVSKETAVNRACVSCLAHCACTCRETGRNVIVPQVCCRVLHTTYFVDGEHEVSRLAADRAARPTDCAARPTNVHNSRSSKNCCGDGCFRDVAAHSVFGHPCDTCAALRCWSVTARVTVQTERERGREREKERKYRRFWAGRCPGEGGVGRESRGATFF